MEDNTNKCATAFWISTTIDNNFGNYFRDYVISDESKLVTLANTDDYFTLFDVNKNLHYMSTPDYTDQCWKQSNLYPSRFTVQWVTSWVDEGGRSFCYTDPRDGNEYCLNADNDEGGFVGIDVEINDNVELNDEKDKTFTLYTPTKSGGGKIFMTVNNGSLYMTAQEFWEELRKADPAPTMWRDFNVGANGNIPCYYIYIQ